MLDSENIGSSEQHDHVTETVESIEQMLSDRKKAKRKIEAALAAVERANKNHADAVEEYNTISRKIAALASREML